MGKEKKEIGKLIELLNEYDGKNHWWDYDEEYLTSEEFYGENGDLEIISKKFGFIKWLVENDKIDRDKELKENGLFRKYFYDLEYVKNYDRLVIWLSVEDEPIRFLCEILK